MIKPTGKFNARRKLTLVAPDLAVPRWYAVDFAKSETGRSSVIG